MDTCQPSPLGSNKSKRRTRCNSQVCLAYLFSLLASVVILHGFHLYFKKNNQVWLVLPGFGVVLILFGSCLYRSGSLRKTVSTRKKRKASKRTSNQLFESQLSLNMLPQCFSNTNPRTLNANGHRYLTLPLDSNVQTHSTVQSVLVESSHCNPDKSSTGQTQECIPVQAGDNQSDSSECDCMPTTVEQSANDCASSDTCHAIDSAPVSPNDSLQTDGSSDNISVDCDVQFGETLIELNVVNSEELTSVHSDQSVAFNEAPPTYDEVIDFDSSILIECYRTL